MAVVATSMHAACHLAGMGNAAFFHDRQGVHVGTQTDGPLTISQTQTPDDAMAADIAGHLIAPFIEVRGHHGRGGDLLEGQLRIAVQVLAQLGQELLGIGQIADLAIGFVIAAHTEDP